MERGALFCPDSSFDVSFTYLRDTDKERGALFCPDLSFDVSFTRVIPTRKAVLTTYLLAWYRHGTWRSVLS